MSSLANLLTLAAAARLLPNKPHPSALWRWARRGLRARNGQIVFLQHTRLGGRVYVTEEALADFGRKLAEADVAANGSPEGT